MAVADGVATLVNRPLVTTPTIMRPVDCRRIMAVARAEMVGIVIAVNGVAGINSEFGTGVGITVRAIIGIIVSPVITPGTNTAAEQPQQTRSEKNHQKFFHNGHL
jgi:hypothetical protein